MRRGSQPYASRSQSADHGLIVGGDAGVAELDAAHVAQCIKNVRARPMKRRLWDGILRLLRPRGRGADCPGCATVAQTPVCGMGGTRPGGSCDCIPEAGPCGGPTRLRCGRLPRVHGPGPAAVDARAEAAISQDSRAGIGVRRWCGSSRGSGPARRRAGSRSGHCRPGSALSDW